MQANEIVLESSYSAPVTAGARGLDNLVTGLDEKVEDEDVDLVFDSAPAPALGGKRHWEVPEDGKLLEVSTADGLDNPLVALLKEQFCSNNVRYIPELSVEPEPADVDSCLLP